MTSEIQRYISDKIRGISVRSFYMKRC